MHKHGQEGGVGRGRWGRKNPVEKPRNPNRLKSVGSLALCILLPHGGLCSATRAEPEALSVPFFSDGGVLSLTPPARSWAAMKAEGDLRCACRLP